MWLFVVQIAHQFWLTRAAACNTLSHFRWYLNHPSCTISTSLTSTLCWAGTSDNAHKAFEHLPNAPTKASNNQTEHHQDASAWSTCVAPRKAWFFFPLIIIVSTLQWSLILFERWQF
mmetsp:Transcript_5519/g.13439  ORF Transcript_5519/g.13439 Transcript_5519/m.13439 type:complete len:117 (-) Transcript_5519:80-430(-)